MAVELVTGYSGTEHVSSSDDGARQAGTVGTGMYALETVEDPLAATLENANTVTVGPGDVLINGRHVRLTGSTTFAVPVGTQAMQTSNLLVLRYSVSDDGTEKVEAVTLTGEPAASDPQDPALATGSVLDGDSPVDMPLYRVVTTGIESAQPVRLFSTVPPIAGLTLGGLPGSLTSDQLPVVPVSKGGTGATSAAGARGNLGMDGREGYFKAYRGTVVSSLSRDNLYNLAPGTYLVANNATGGPESGYYGNLLVGYCAGNRIVGLLAYDNGHVYTTCGASSVNTFTWVRVPNSLTIGTLLWSGTWSSGSITAPGSSAYTTLLVTFTTNNGSAYSPETALCWRDSATGKVRGVSMDAGGTNLPANLRVTGFRCASSGDALSDPQLTRVQFAGGFTFPFGSVTAVRGLE